MKILQINSSLKKEHSYSSKLSNAIIEKLREKNSAVRVTHNKPNTFVSIR